MNNTDKYYNGFVKEYNYNSVCHFMSNYLEIEINDSLLYEIPRVLLSDYIDIISTQNV
jgi:hypothetical protein